MLVINDPRGATGCILHGLLHRTADCATRRRCINHTPVEDCWGHYRSADSSLPVIRAGELAKSS